MMHPSRPNSVAGPSKPVEIPFYPAFSIEKRLNGITVYWFEKDFSQISYGSKPERGRNACVIIVLLTASKLALHSSKLSSKNVEGGSEMQHPNHVMIKCFAEGILQGIQEYANFIDQNKAQNLNLTIPEAYKALGGMVANIHEWKSFIYVVNMAENLHNFLLEGIHAWNFKSLAKKHLLFVILIADARAVLIVVDQIINTITFIDSHPHAATHGACIASTDLPNIKSFCKWICKLFKDLYNSTPECFELSYFQVKCK